MQPKQPKISQKLLVRSAIGLFLVAGLLMAFRWYKNIESDPNQGYEFDSRGMLAVLKATPDGQLAAFLNPDGKLTEQTGVAPEVEDRDLEWRPDGNALFFSSNRVGQRFTMFRWAPGKTPEQRAVGSRAQAAPAFLASDADLHGDAHALVIMGGKVMEYDAKKPALVQVLPPVSVKNRVVISGDSDSGGGASSPFEAQYADIGTSFRKAKWLPDKSAVIAVMRRERGEVLIYQKLNAVDQLDAQPRPIMAGDRVDFDIDQKSGITYFSVQNFQWLKPEMAPQQFRKGAKVTTPYRHLIGKFDPNGTLETSVAVLVGLQDDKMAFTGLAMDPRGESLLLVFGAYKGEGSIEPQGIALFPASATPESKPLVIAKGDLYEPSWSPDGSKIAFAQRESSTSRPIMEVDRAGASIVRISPQDGVFSYPKYSPQMAK